MPETPRFFRLRIRNAVDSADALVITSVRGGTNPYLQGPPKGDGQSFEPIDGSVKTGSYTVLVIDVETTANNRVVTSQLADANARYQLLSRRAYIEQSTDGSAWSGLIVGYVNAVRLVSPLTYEFAIGDSRRTEVSTEIFKSVILRRDPLTGAPTYSRFDKPTMIIGGPVLEDFASARNHGGWRVRVSQVVAGTEAGTKDATGFVQLKLRRNGWFDPRKPFRSVEEFTDKATINYTNQLTQGHFFESTRRQSVGIMGHFPNLVYRVETPAGALAGLFTPVSEPFGVDVKRPDYITRPGESSFWVNWTGTIQPDGSFKTAPTVGDEYKLFLFATDISETNPLHIKGHPLHIREQLWLDYGIPYNVAALNTTAQAIGSEMWVALRITKSWKMAEFEKLLDGVFGTATRINSSGERVAFTTRIKNSAAPSSTYTIADLRNHEGIAFEIDEGTVSNKVTVTQQRFTEYDDSDRPDVDPPDDTLLMSPQTVEVENGDSQTPGDHETLFDIPGRILGANGADINLEDFTVGIAGEFFDRFGRGAPGGDLHFLPSFTALLGEEVNLDLVHLPNPVAGASPVTQRGGSRIYQVVRRTETPSGPDVRVLDAGTSVQAATAPTFTLAASADDPRRIVIATLTNAVALAAAGLKVRVEMGTGASTPTDGTLVTILDPAVSSVLTLPAFDAGTKAWVRMRSDRTGGRPSAFTAFSSVTLDALDPPTGLAVSAQDAADISKRLLTWTPGTNALDMPVEVYLRLTSETSASDQLIAILPPSSDQYLLTALDVADRTATVRHAEAAPARGVSTSATVAVNTTGSSGTLEPPYNPQGWAKQDGTFGMYVTAYGAYPIEFEVAVGAGSYALAQTIPAVDGERIKFQTSAPNDGVVRHIKARHAAAGWVSSAYTTPVDVTPWTLSKPFDWKIPGFELDATATDSAGRLLTRALVKADAADPDTIAGVPEGTLTISDETSVVEFRDGSGGLRAQQETYTNLLGHGIRWLAMDAAGGGDPGNPADFDELVWEYNVLLDRGLLYVNGDFEITKDLRLLTLSTPASASAAGITGTVKIDGNYIYVCVATNTWKRTAISTW